MRIPSFLSILLIILRRGSIYLDSCLSFSRYCCSSDWLELAGLMTELGLPLRHRKMINRISLELPAEQSRDRQEKDPSPLHVHSTAPNPPFASILPPPPPLRFFLPVSSFDSGYAGRGRRLGFPCVVSGHSTNAVPKTCPLCWREPAKEEITICLLPCPFTLPIFAKQNKK